MSKFQKILLKLLLVAVSIFGVTFVVYFFNLDMKLTSIMEPFLIKHYDSMKRNSHL